jgi:phosphatidate cytidylyltransferase
MTRIISALILIPLALLAVIYAPLEIFLIGIGIVGTICLYEYFGLVRAMKFEVQPWFGYIIFWVLLIGFRQSRFPATVIVALALIAFFLSAMWRSKRPIRERALGLMAELLGVFYCAFFLYPAVPIRYDFGDRTGIHWTLLLLGTVWAGDTIALALGKTLGRRPFAPVLSPKKTKEGAIAGLLAGIVFAAALQHFLFSDLPFRHVIAISVLIGIFGQLGDLAESMLKRAAEIKDSSHLIPGHGGMLDRMDSLLFTFPILYFYMLLIYNQN